MSYELDFECIKHSGDGNNYRDANGMGATLESAKSGSNICLVYNGSNHYDALKKIVNNG